jgi:HlyD family secretion protein
LILALLSAFLLWACFGKLDIVAVASGKLVPQTFVKVSQPVEAGAVKKIFVHDGDHVTAGQPLVEMDSAYAYADVATERAEAAIQELRLERITAELTNKVFARHAAQTAIEVAAESEYRLRRAAYKTSVRDADFAVAKATEDYLAAQARLGKLQTTSSLAAEQAAIHSDLQKAALVSRSAELEKLTANADLQGELAMQRKATESARFAQAQAQEVRAKVDTEYRKALALEQSDAQAAFDKANIELSKRSHRQDELTLRAPAAGIVTSLAVKTEGQVMQAGGTVLTVVPDNAPLIFEGWLKNEDAPFITPGMSAKTKLVAYPFQKYGWLTGTVSWLGANSEVPESMKSASGDPLFYPVRVALNAQSLERNRERFDTKPGMQGEADIEIGSRTLAEYLLASVKKVSLEAVREK